MPIFLWHKLHSSPLEISHQVFNIHNDSISSYKGNSIVRFLRNENVEENLENSSLSEKHSETILNNMGDMVDIIFLKFYNDVEQKVIKCLSRTIIQPTFFLKFLKIVAQNR